MSNAFRLPTLSSSGVLENPSLILDRLIKYFLASNQNQSNIFQSEVASLKYIVHLYSKNPSGFKDALINSLDKLLKRYKRSDGVGSKTPYSTDYFDKQTIGTNGETINVYTILPEDFIAK